MVRNAVKKKGPLVHLEIHTMPVKYYLAVLCNLFEVSLKLALETYVRRRDVVRCSDVDRTHVTKRL